ncbi:sodium:solute symport protein [Salmonella enterica subsp. enterica serovar Choleraesuis]|nr:sodium:solute symport protein [Salmonella enterica subsp. enterica serovar Choleraesuis]
MTTHGIILTTILLYVLFMIGVALYAKKRIRNSDDYHLAGRRLGVLMLAGTLAATEIGGGSTIGVTAKAYGEWGLSAAWYVIATGIGIFLAAFIAPYMRRSLATTVPEIIGKIYGKPSHLITSVLSVVSLIALSAAQMTACATVVSGLLEIPFAVAVILSGVLLVFYTWVGGMWSLTMTDFIQFFIIVFGFSLAIIYILWQQPEGAHALFARLPAEKMQTTKLGWGAIVGLIVMYFMTFCTGQEAVQRLCSAKNERVAITGALVCGIVMVLYAFVPALFGLVAVSIYPDINPNEALTTLAAGQLPPVFAGLVLSAVLFATISSGSGDLLGAASISIKDIYYGYIRPGEEDNGQALRNSRIMVLVVGALGIIIALASQQIIELLVFAFTIRATGPFAAYLFGLLASAPPRRAGFISIATGTVCGIAWQAAGQPFGIYAVIIGSLASLLSYLLVWKLVPC